MDTSCISNGRTANDATHGFPSIQTPSPITRVNGKLIFLHQVRARIQFIEEREKNTHISNCLTIKTQSSISIEFHLARIEQSFTIYTVYHIIRHLFSLRHSNKENYCFHIKWYAHANEANELLTGVGVSKNQGDAAAARFVVRLNHAICEKNSYKHQ